MFFLGFFFQSDRPTQYQETHSTVNEEKKGGWPYQRRMHAFNLAKLFFLRDHQFFNIFEGAIVEPLKTGKIRYQNNLLKSEK